MDSIKEAENIEGHFAPETGFNIAAAFPVTDEVVRRARVHRLRRQIAVARDFASRPEVRWSAAVALATLVGVAWLRRRGVI